MQFEAIMRRAGGFDRLQTGETRDPMIDMDDNVARRKRTRFGQKILGAARLAAATEQPIAQDILFADKREIGRLETLLDANDRQGQCGWRKREGLRKRGHRRRAGKAVVGEDMGEPLARAVRPGGEDNPLAACLQGTQMADSGGKDIGVWIGALGGERAALF